MLIVVFLIMCLDRLLFSEIDRIRDLLETLNKKMIILITNIITPILKITQQYKSNQEMIVQWTVTIHQEVNTSIKQIQKCRATE
jgi:hypothetical protein